MMNIPETQKDVLVYLDGLTRELGNCKLDQFTTASIASSLVISRNLASQYLNGLVRADLAVKAGGKPVYYFHRRSLERYLQTPVSRNVYSSIDELFERAGADSSASFESVVGWDLSLSECVQRLRSAMVYPPQGIPVLLAGARGTGKTLLSRAAFDYAVSEGILSASSHRVIIDCSRLRDGVVDMQNDICSAIDASCTGTSSSKFNGMIFFRNVEELSMQARDAVLSKFAPESTQGESTERISAFLNRQIGTIRAVFSTSCDPSSLEMKELSRHFPLVVNVPGLRDRTPEERSELCLRFLKEEGRRIGVDVFISKSAFRRLSDAEYDEEVRGMRACVTSCCASAFLDHKGDRIDIRAYQLPNGLVESAGQSGDTQADGAQLIDAARTSFVKDGGRETKLLTEIVENYESYSTGVLTFDEFMGSVLEATRDLEDYLMFEERRLSGKWDAFAHVVEEVIESVNDLYSINLSRKSSIVIAREVGSQLSPMARLSRWKSVHIQSVDALAALIRSHNRFAASVSDRITSEIYSILGIEVDALTWTLVALHAWGFETKDRRKNFGIILAHGYSTATSIADAANRLLGARLFEAIDMPYELQVRDIVRPLRSLIDRFSYCDEVVILVDTGSLKTIHEDLGQLSDKTIGVINNVSTGLALEVGAGMLAGLSMDEMLSEAVHSCTSSYRIVERSSRPDAIIFCEEGGIEAAEKIKTLVAQSLGQESSIRLIACNYFQLMDNGKEDAVFSRYTVRAAIGTSDLHLSGVPFIALEDLIAGVDNAQVNRTFSRFLDDASLQLFHRNLIKNMTLRNVVESITILNPSKLFAEIERAVSMLQTFTDTSIEGRMIGLYVHLCCLVERLVTRTPIENYEDKDNFTEEHSDFIDAFRESFSDIASHYHVEVPIAEIAYAYDYIFPAHALRKRVPSQDGSVVQEDE